MNYGEKKLSHFAFTSNVCEMCEKSQLQMRYMCDGAQARESDFSENYFVLLALYYLLTLPRINEEKKTASL